MAIVRSTHRATPTIVSMFRWHDAEEPSWVLDSTGCIRHYGALTMSSLSEGTLRRALQEGAVVELEKYTWSYPLGFRMNTTSTTYYYRLIPAPYGYWDRQWHGGDWAHVVEVRLSTGIWTKTYIRPDDIPPNLRLMIAWDIPAGF